MERERRKKEKKKMNELGVMMTLSGVVALSVDNDFIG